MSSLLISPSDISPSDSSSPGSVYRWRAELQEDEVVKGKNSENSERNVQSRKLKLQTGTVAVITPFLWQSAFSGLQSDELLCNNHLFLSLSHSRTDKENIGTRGHSIHHHYPIDKVALESGVLNNEIVMKNPAGLHNIQGDFFNWASPEFAKC